MLLQVLSAQVSHARLSHATSLPHWTRLRDDAEEPQGLLERANIELLIFGEGQSRKCWNSRTVPYDR